MTIASASGASLGSHGAVAITVRDVCACRGPIKNCGWHAEAFRDARAIFLDMLSSIFGAAPAIQRMIDAFRCAARALQEAMAYAERLQHCRWQ